MTYREYITTTAKRFGLDNADIALLLANQAKTIPDPDADVDTTTAKRALVAEFATLLPLANISEGGMSVTWNIDAIKMWYNTTCDELGIPATASGRPRFRNKSNIW